MTRSDAGAVRSVRVGLGERTYSIFVGENLLEQTHRYMAPLLKRPRTVIISDQNVWRAQGARLRDGLHAGHIAFDELILPAGEATKSFGNLQYVLSRLLDLGVDRGDLVIAFGGGVIGDLTGFACAILRRGCRFVQIPTTLLAQVDSAVGGKTAINVEQGKNLIGAFHQPTLVLADINALDTLPARELKAGYAEVVKYGALGDHEFFSWLETQGQTLLEGDATARIRAIETSCAKKADIVERDEKETGERALLNLGHTFGHALEAAFGYSDKLLHGEAVAAGMGLAFNYSAFAGHCPVEAAQRLKRHLKSVGLPTGLTDIDGAEQFSADALLTLMKQDKKVEAGSLALILVHDIGAAFVQKNADINHIKKFLEEKAAR